MKEDDQPRIPILHSIISSDWLYQIAFPAVSLPRGPTWLH